MNHPIRVHVVASSPPARARLLTVLDGQPGIEPTDSLEGHDRSVVLSAAGSAGEATRLFSPAHRSAGHRLVVVADTLTTTGVRDAVRAGACALLSREELTPTRLATALRLAHQGNGSLPLDLVSGLLNRPAPGEAVRADSPAGPGSGRLTERQTHVLRLIADGYDNAAIARTLSCSQHTVKNVIYDLMARMQVRNRVQAVAQGVRTGLI